MIEDAKQEVLQDAEQEFKRRLLAKGLLRPRRRPKTVNRVRHTIQVDGKPLSETVMEDRR